MSTTTKITVSTRNQYPTVQAALPTSQEFITMAHLTSHKILRVEDRKKPLKLIAAIDVSQSMTGEKLQLAVASLKFMVDQLGAQDEFGVVTFGTESQCLIPVQRMTRQNRQNVKKAIDRRIRAFGRTNLSGGLLLAMNLNLPRAVVYPTPSPMIYPPVPYPHYYPPTGLPPGYGGPVASPYPYPGYPGGGGAVHYPGPYPAGGERVRHHGHHMTRQKASVTVTTTGAPPAANNTAAVLPVIIPTFYVTVKGQHALVPKEGKKLHAHWYQVQSTPAAILEKKYITNVVFEANGSSAKSGVDVAMDLQEQPIAGVAVQLKLASGHVTKLLHIPSDSTSDESTPVVYKVEAGVAALFPDVIPENIAEPPALDIPAPQPQPPVSPPPTEMETPVATTVTTTTTTTTDDYCRAVMLFTDGQANEGITNTGLLCSQIDAINAQVPGRETTIHTFGFGASHNATMLRQISEKTQGSYYYIPDSTTMKQVFADCLGGLVSIVAQSVQIIVTPHPGVGITKIMTHFPVTTSPAHPGAHIITMKDLYSEELRDIPVQVNICPGYALLDDAPLLNWEVQYDNCVTGERDIVKCKSSVTVAGEKYSGPVDLAVDEQINRYNVTDALEAARRDASNNDFAGAKKRLSSCKRAVGGSASAAQNDNAYITNLMGDMDDCDEMLTSSRWEREGTKQFQNYAMGHAQQRCCRPSASAVYQNQFKKEMKAAVSGI